MSTTSTIFKAEKEEECLEDLSKGRSVSNSITVSKSFNHGGDDPEVDLLILQCDQIFVFRISTSAPAGPTVAFSRSNAVPFSHEYSHILAVSSTRQFVAVVGFK